MKIEDYTENYYQEIADLFYQSVHAIDTSLYNQKQKEAWASAIPDYEHWRERLSRKKPFIAFMQNKVAGFLELESDGHIDCLYIHPDFQNMGVATSLLAHAVEYAYKQKMMLLYVEASLVARPFFEKNGFSLVAQNQVHRNNTVLVNFKMQRVL